MRYIFVDIWLNPLYAYNAMKCLNPSTMLCSNAVNRRPCGWLTPQQASLVLCLQGVLRIALFGYVRILIEIRWRIFVRRFGLVGSGEIALSWQTNNAISCRHQPLLLKWSKTTTLMLKMLLPFVLHTRLPRKLGDHLLWGESKRTLMHMLGRNVTGD